MAEHPNLKMMHDMEAAGWALVGFSDDGTRTPAQMMQFYRDLYGAGRRFHTKDSLDPRDEHKYVFIK